MASRQIHQFFNKHNMMSIWNMLLDEDVAPNKDHLTEITAHPYRHHHTQTSADNEMMQAIRQYFDSIGLDRNAVYQTREQAMHILRDRIHRHKKLNSLLEQRKLLDDKIRELKQENDYSGTKQPLEMGTVKKFIDDSTITVKHRPDFRVQPAVLPTPPPPKKLERYVDSDEYFWRNLKQNTQRKIKDDSDIPNLDRKSFKPMDFNKEAEAIIKQSTAKNSTYKFQDDAMIVNEPNDMDKFIAVLNGIHDRYENTDEVHREDEPVVNYYLNKLASHEDIEKYIRHIYDVEVKPFKIRMSFGNIVEDAQDRKSVV